MTTFQKTRVRAIALEGEDSVARKITLMLHLLEQTNSIEPLPEDFFDHMEDLKSARGTIERVCAGLRELTKGKGVPA